MSQFAAPDNLHIYPILIDKPNAKSQSVFPVHWWTEKSKKLSFRAGGLSNFSPVFSLTKDRQLHRLCFIWTLFALKEIKFEIYERTFPHANRKHRNF